MKSILKWKNHLSIYLLVLALVNVALIRLPLTNVFGYEFSVINSMVIVFLTAIYTINFYDAEFVKNTFFTSELFESVSILLAVPFLVSTVNSFVSGFCSFIDGLLFYLVITAPSIIIGVALAMISVFLSNRFRGIWLFLFYIGILFIIVLEIYFNPQVYVFNPIIGFFPGTIYDEGISVTWKLFFYRVLNVIFFGFIISSIVRIKRKKGGSKKSLRIIISLVVLAAFYIFSPTLGFSTTRTHLETELSNQLESEHFIIQYDKRIDDNDLKYLAVSQEYYYHQLKDFFLLELNEKIQIYVFYDDDQKKELFGSRNADVAKPWLNQIYISFTNWEHTLRHELAHCFSGAFGTGIFKLSSGLNPMLIEGIAEAADGQYMENSLHYMASLAYNKGYKVDVEQLLSKYGFFSSVSSLSYIYSGSFIKYLIQNEGIVKFKEFYASGDFNKSYGYELSKVVKEYYSFLENYEGNLSEDKALFHFGGKTLFQKVCPRVISEDLKKGWKQIRIYDFQGAEQTFTGILDKTDNYSAFVGLANSFEKQDNLPRAIDLLTSSIEDYKSTSYYYNIELYLADLYAKEGNLRTADSIYSALIMQNPNRTLNYLSNVRKVLINEKQIREYLNGSDYDRYYILHSINRISTNYWTIPVLITLSKRLEEDYRFFLDNFNMNFHVNSYESSYAMLQLSEYMLANFDVKNARRISTLSLGYNSDKDFSFILQEQFHKANWFYHNSKAILNTFRYSKTN